MYRLRARASAIQTILVAPEIQGAPADPATLHTSAPARVAGFDILIVHSLFSPR
jgi:hypothetical protein